MATLGFILECGAAAALIGIVASLPVAALWLALGSSRDKLSASARADLAFVSAVLPAIAAVAGVLATAAPSIFAAVGWAEDHCVRHTHDLHVCIVHSPGLNPGLAVLGAAAIAIWIYRAAALAASALDMLRDLRALERLGTKSPGRWPTIEVPGEPRLCHAVGYLRGRVLVSSSLSARLSPDHLACALAHEHAHLERRDPLANLLMSVAALFHPPFICGLFQRAYRTASEEACDDQAAIVAGGGARVAEALVDIAALQLAGRPRPELVPAFGEHALEHRVRRLLANTPLQVRPSRALLIALLSGVAVALAAGFQSHAIHHGVETVLRHLF